MSQSARLVGVLPVAICALLFVVSASEGAPGQTFGADAPAAPAAKAAAGSAPFPAPAVTGDEFLALQQRYIGMDEKVRPAVVQVNTLVTEEGKDTTYLATGFFINSEGYILTSDAHHLQEAKRVTISHDGFKYPAEVKGLDVVTNLALLRAVQLPKSFSVIKLAEDSEQLPPRGTLLMGVAYKLLGLDPTLVTGVVEGYTVDYGDTKFPTLHLRTNIEDYGGEDGSPLLDLTGNLVGILIAALPDAHASLVLPTRAILRVQDDLFKYGHVIYGSFGFESHENPDDAAGTRSVLIGSVWIYGPALAAGLRAYDQLLALGDVPIHTDADLRQATFFAHPGENLTVRVNRDGKEIELHLRVGEMEQAAMPTNGPAEIPRVPDVATPATGNNNTSVADPPPGAPLPGLPAATRDPQIPPPDIIEKK